MVVLCIYYREMKQKACQVRAGQLAQNQTHPFSPPPNRTSPRAATRLWCRTPLATDRHTTPHDAPYLRPRSVPAPHSSATIVVQMCSTLQLRRALEARRSRVNRCLGDGALKRALEAHVTPLRGDPGKSVDNLWITWGKPSSYPRRQGSYPQATPTYPQVIHRLSTGYPQVNSSHAM